MSDDLARALEQVPGGQKALAGLDEADKKVLTALISVAFNYG